MQILKLFYIIYEKYVSNKLYFYISKLLKKSLVLIYFFLNFSNKNSF